MMTIPKVQQANGRHQTAPKAQPVKKSEQNTRALPAAPTGCFRVSVRTCRPERCGLQYETVCQRTASIAVISLLAAQVYRLLTTCLATAWRVVAGYGGSILKIL